MFSPLFVYPVPFFFLMCPMDPLIRPEFLLLVLEQGDRSLEDHTRLFLLLARKAERLSRGSPWTQSLTCQTRCESWRQCPLWGSKPWTLRARSGAPPTSPQLKVSWSYIWDCWTSRGTLLTGKLSWKPICPLSSLLRPAQSSRVRESVLKTIQEWALILEGSPESPEAHECPHSCLLHRCHLAAALLALSPPSIQWVLRDCAILCRRGLSIPHLCLWGPNSSTRLLAPSSPST